MTSRHVLTLVLLVAVFTTPAWAKDDWLPVSSADLALKDNPAQPGAAAMILHREIFTDNQQDFETHYTRIKIFKDEGKKYADVEIPYWHGVVDIGDIKARTIRPDGSIVVFSGKPFDKLVVKSRWVKLQAKAFSLPDVQPGSIVEFKYTYRFENRLIPPTWEVQDDLFTRHLKFVARPYPEMDLRWIMFNLPNNITTRQEQGNVILELDNIAGVDEESYMPPERTIKSRVDFFYSRRMEKNAEDFWNREAKEWNEAIEQFIGKRNGIAQAAAQIAPASDPPEVRLKKLYDRVQQIRNLSYEKEKTEKEQAREKLKDNNNVEDVLKHGYGSRTQINRLFVALARADGFHARVVRVSERDTNFFNPQLLEADQLDGEVAMVVTESKAEYYDPGIRFCPFGLLSWQRSGVKGLLPSKDGASFVVTTQPAAAHAVTERRVDLRLTPDGTLEGKLELLFQGQEALQRRLEARYWDDTERRKDLEKDIKEWIPSGASVTIDSMTGWEGTEEPLRILVSLKIPGYAMSTGRRMLVPRGLFQASGHPFRHATRVHPVYFEFPFAAVDEVTLTLPPGFTVETLPATRNQQTGFAQYSLSAESQANVVKMHRKFVMSGFFIPPEHYPLLKEFYDRLSAADEEQLVLRTTGNASN